MHTGTDPSREQGRRIPDPGAERTQVLDPGAERTQVLDPDAERTQVLDPDAERTQVLDPGASREHDPERTRVLERGGPGEPSGTGAPAVPEDMDVQDGTAAADGTDRHDGPHDPDGPEDRGGSLTGGPASPAGPLPAPPDLPAPARARRPERSADDQAVSSRPERTVDVVAGDYLLTVNPVDGSEVTHCPPAARPEPRRRTGPQRTEVAKAAQPPHLAGRAGPELPLLERSEERERLIRLLARGRSVRVTGPSGAGRTSLLATVAEGCADVAPDGVVRLSGYRRTPRDLLHALFAAVYEAPGHRPDRPRLLELLRDVGAIVVVDDIEFGGTALEELVTAAPECAFLISATPEVTAPVTDSLIEEVFLPGLSRVACLEMLERAVDRALEDAEEAWAADLWFESEGLPLRFVQAGALLRQRDARRAELAGETAVSDLLDPFDRPDRPAGPPVPGHPGRCDASRHEGREADGTAASPFSAFGAPPPAVPPAVPPAALGVFDSFGVPGGAARSPENGRTEPGGPDQGPGLAAPAPEQAPAPAPAQSAPAPAPEQHGSRPGTPLAVPSASVPLPTLAESAAPARRLAAGLDPAGREVLRFALALGGECPNPAHLPALVGDTNGDDALGELVARGLAVPVASHYRLAAGVRTQLAATGSPGPHARSAAQHFTWWAGHPSVSPDRVAAEAETVLAAMAASRDAGEHGTAVRLARAAAPAFAAALHWSAWERALRLGQESARAAGEVAEEAYFHHDLGVLALCTGNVDRARAELEASIALRGALADRQGTVVGRRTLALASDRALGIGHDPSSARPAAKAAGAGTAGAGARGAAQGAGKEPAGRPAFSPVRNPPGAGAGGSAPTVPTTVPSRGGRDGGGPVTAVISRRLFPDGAGAVGSRRNLVLVGAGVLIAAVLGAVVTLGSTAGTGGEPGTPMNVAPVDTQPDDEATDDGPPLDHPLSPSAEPSTSGSPSATPTDTFAPAVPRPPVFTPAPSRPPASKPPTSKPTTGRPTTKPPGTNGGSSSTGGSTGTTSSGTSAGTTSGTTSGTTTGTTGGTTSGTTDGGTATGTTSGTTAGTDGGAETAGGGPAAPRP